MFGKKDDAEPGRMRKAFDAGADLKFNAHDLSGTTARQRDVLRTNQQLQLLGALLTEQRRTNELLQQLIQRPPL